MKKYNVVFAIDFEIEAEDSESAIEAAELLFSQEMKERPGEDIFGVNCEEVDKK